MMLDGMTLDERNAARKALQWVLDNVNMMRGEWPTTSEFQRPLGLLKAILEGKLAEMPAGTVGATCEVPS